MAKRYQEEFKKQIVALYNNGKSLADLNREYGIIVQRMVLIMDRCKK